MASASAPPPDPAVTKATESNTRIAEAMEARAADNDRFFRENFAPRLMQGMDDQIRMGRELQDFQLGLARKYDDRYWDTTGRYQDQVNAAIDVYDTDANRQRIAGAAGADVEQQFAASQGQMQRGLQRQGVNPNSGMALMMQQALTRDRALAKAGAMTTAREAARREGFNLRSQAAGMGMGLASASQASAAQAAAASGMGIGAANNAANSFGAADARWNTALGQASGLYGAAGAMGQKRWDTQWQTNQANAQATNQMIGTGIGLAAAAMSDRRLKVGIQRIATRPDGLGVYEFEYVWGGGRRVGLMADEVACVYPEAVFDVGGYQAVDYSKV